MVTFRNLWNRYEHNFCFGNVKKKVCIDCNWNRTQNNLLLKRTLKVAQVAKWSSCVLSAYLYGALDYTFCHGTYAFQSESTLYSCLNVKELLARSRRKIWRWSDCNWNRTQNHLVLKPTLNHLAKLAKQWSCVLSTYLYGALECMFLLYHVRVSEWIHTL